MSLIASNTKRVQESTVMLVPEPEFTHSWHPMSHRKVITSLTEAVEGVGMGIVNKEYSLTKNQNNMFGTWQLDHSESNLNWMVGFRNSISKAFAVGFCAGTHITVCDNMMFSGEMVEFRKHTGHLTYEELKELTKRALKKVVEKIKKLTIWHNDLKNFNLEAESDEFKLLTYTAMKYDVIPPSRLLTFLDCHKEEVALNGESLYTWHGGVTRLMKADSLFNINHRSGKLEGFCDDYIELKKVA